MNHVGVDVAKDKLDVVLLHDDQSQYAVFDNTVPGLKKLERWLTKRCSGEAHICLEATGRYGDALAETLHQAGYVISVVNPARIKAFADSRLSRQKTDKVDAHLIALFCQSQQPDTWTPPEPAQRELQAMVRHLEALKAMRQQERNRLSAENPAPAVRQAIQKHVDFLTQQIQDLEDQIRDHIQQHPKLKQQHDLLDSIPGLGDTTIAIILGEVADIQRFDHAPQLAAYAGLTPRQHRSGSSVRGRTRISKRGNARLRAALYFPAMVAIRHNPILRTFAERLELNGLAPNG